MDCNEAVVTMSAVRYMLGRGSYGVGCVCDYIKKRKKDLDESQIEVIERDILQYIKNHQDTPYEQDWLDLVEFIKT